MDLIVAQADPAAAWKGICEGLREIAIQATKAGALDKATVIPDRLLANTAWILWDDFQHHAPTAVDELKRFWVPAGVSGPAVLILDGLSLRELPMVLTAAKERGLSATRAEALGSQVPSDTDSFAAALGLAGRSKLSNNRPPRTFIFSGPDVHTDVL